MELSTWQRQHLRGLAHPLRPAVRAFKPKQGELELTERLLKEIGRQLDLNELIKVKLQVSKKAVLVGMLPQILDATGAAWVQTIGHTVVLYKARAVDPTIVIPKERHPAGESDQGAGEE